MCVPSIAPIASLKKGIYLGSLEIFAGVGSLACGKCTYFVYIPGVENASSIFLKYLCTVNQWFKLKKQYYFEIVSFDRWNRSPMCLIVKPVTHA